MISRVLQQTIVTDSLDAGVAAWEEEIGWELAGSGEVDDKLSAYLGAPPDEFTRFASLASPSRDRGGVRLLEGPRADRTETFHQPGLFNTELLCSDVDALHERLTRSTRFQVLCEPTTYDLGSTGGAKSRSFATRGPGGAGVFFTTYLSVPPPRELPRCDHLVCGMFNAALATSDGEAMAAFFEGVLGMERRLEGRIASAAINRILDLPEELAFHMVVYKGEGEGLIEVDVHDHELPRPAGESGSLKAGNSFLTLESPALDGIRRRAEEAGVLVGSIEGSSAAPYFGRPAVLLTGPEGQPLEVVGAA